MTRVPSLSFLYWSESLVETRICHFNVFSSLSLPHFSPFSVTRLNKIRSLPNSPSIWKRREQKTEWETFFFLYSVPFPFIDYSIDPQWMCALKEEFNEKLITHHEKDMFVQRFNWHLCIYVWFRFTFFPSFFFFQLIQWTFR